MLALAVSGASFATAQAPTAANLGGYVKPAKLVKLPGGRTLNLDCRGKGSPTVILFAGLTSWSERWSKVQPEIATKTRVCSFDPPGIGHSGPSGAPQDAAHITADVEAALKAAKIAGPYLLVGHSAGSYDVLHFADHRLKDVVGIVLVDPSIPDQPARFAKVARAYQAADVASDTDTFAKLNACSDKLKLGPIAPDAPDAAECFGYRPSYSPALKSALEKEQGSPQAIATRISHIRSFSVSAKAAIDPKRTYGALPLIVLTAGALSAGPDASAEVQQQMPALRIEWMKAHDEYAALSTRGVNRVVEGSGHSIPSEKPEAVIATIEEVLKAAKT